MPVYVYRNLKTGETFELEQRITEPALTEHPETGDPIKRLVQPVGITFKGSGFYVTDSRKEHAKVAKGEKAESKSESKSEGKAESKPAGAASSGTKSD